VVAAVAVSTPAAATTSVVRLTSDSARQGETSMAISAANPAVMLVGHNDGRSIHGHSGNMGYEYTTNGGATGSDWTKNLYLKGITRSDSSGLQWGHASDPVVVYSAKDDTFKFATIGATENQATSVRQTGIVYDSSSATTSAPASGLTWIKPITVPGTVGTQTDFDSPSCGGSWTDKPDMAVDNNSASPHYGRVYIAWHERGCGDRKVQIWTVHHDVGDAGWSTPVQASVPFPVNWGPSIRVGGSDGKVYVAWCAPTTAAHCNTARADLMLSSSTDGGDSWSFPTVVTTFNMVPSPAPDHSFENNSHPVLSVNPTNSDYVHIVYPAWNGTTADIDYVHSTDGGVYWSSPVTIGSSAHNRYLPWLATSHGGSVLWACYYTEGYASPMLDVACAESTDGATFDTPVRASNTSFDPGPSDWIGDYIATAVESDGSFRTAWAGYRPCCPGKNLDVYLSRGG
jgi:hypothetical protein